MWPGCTPAQDKQRKCYKASRVKGESISLGQVRTVQSHSMAYRLRGPQGSPGLPLRQDLLGSEVPHDSNVSHEIQS